MLELLSFTQKWILYRSPTPLRKIEEDAEEEDGGEGGGEMDLYKEVEERTDGPTTVTMLFLLTSRRTRG